MLPWILLSVFCVCQAFRTREMCYGSDFNFDNLRMYTSYNRLYFTPASFGGPRRLVRKDFVIMDSRYQMNSSTLKLLDVTEKDEGTYSVPIPFSNNTMTVLTVKVKDCDKNIKKVAQTYGTSFSFVLPGDQFELAFSPPDSPFQQVVLWNGTEAGVKGRGGKRDGYWELKKLTQADQGYYTVRNSKGKFISRTLLTVEKHQEFFTMNTHEDFSIIIPLHPVLCTMTFTPDEETKPKEVMKRGLFKGEFFSERIMWVEIPGFLDTFRLKISDLKHHDSGLLEFRDQNNNPAMVVILNVREAPAPVSLFTWVSMIITLVSCCCCVKKCCCKKNTSKPDNSADAPGQTVGYDDNTCQPAESNPIQPSGPSYYSQPAAPTYPSQPPSYFHQPAASSYQAPPAYSLVDSNVSNETTANVTFPQPEVSALGEEGSAPSVPLGLSSDSGIQFELPKGFSYPSAPPLSSDQPSNSVYTSDKLNFL